MTKTTKQTKKQQQPRPNVQFCWGFLHSAVSLTHWHN